MNKALTKESLLRLMCDVSVGIMNYTDLISIPAIADYFNTTKYQVRKLMKELQREGLVESGIESCYSDYCEQYFIIRGFRVTKTGMETDVYKQADKRENEIIEKVWGSRTRMIDFDDMVNELNNDIEFVNSKMLTEGEVVIWLKSLKRENEELRANAMIQEKIIESGGNPSDKDKIVRLIMENSRLKAEKDKAVGDLQKLISRLRGKCNFCKNKDHFLKLEEPCVSCNKVIKQSYEFEGLEVLECEK